MSLFFVSDGSNTVPERIHVVVVVAAVMMIMVVTFGRGPPYCNCHLGKHPDADDYGHGPWCDFRYSGVSMVVPEENEDTDTDRTVVVVAVPSRRFHPDASRAMDE